MKTMKIIDILVKISNNEEVPEKINEQEATNKIFTYDTSYSNLYFYLYMFNII